MTHIDIAGARLAHENAAGTAHFYAGSVGSALRSHATSLQSVNGAPYFGPPAGQLLLVGECVGDTSAERLSAISVESGLRGLLRNARNGQRDAGDCTEWEWTDRIQTVIREASRHSHAATDLDAPTEAVDPDPSVPSLSMAVAMLRWPRLVLARRGDTVACVVRGARCVALSEASTTVHEDVCTRETSLEDTDILCVVTSSLAPIIRRDCWLQLTTDPNQPSQALADEASRLAADDQPSAASGSIVVAKVARRPPTVEATIASSGIDVDRSESIATAQSTEPRKLTCHL